MKKRKINKNILAIIAVAISLLLFGIAFYVASEWNNQKPIDYIDEKTFAELEKLAQTDSKIAEFLQRIKENKEELASYSPSKYSSSNTCINSLLKKDDICRVTFTDMSYPPKTHIYYLKKCGPCLDCIKPVTNGMTKDKYNFTACDYITGSDAKKCDDNCMNGLPIPIQFFYGNERKCAKISNKLEETACQNSCLDDAGCKTCQTCGKPNAFGVRECENMGVKTPENDLASHGNPDPKWKNPDRPYIPAGKACTEDFNDGKEVKESGPYMCNNGVCRKAIIIA